jgi:hypothetical protein
MLDLLSLLLSLMYNLLTQLCGHELEHAYSHMSLQRPLFGKAEQKTIKI